MADDEDAASGGGWTPVAAHPGPAHGKARVPAPRPPAERQSDDEESREAAQRSAHGPTVAFPVLVSRTSAAPTGVSGAAPAGVSAATPAGVATAPHTPDPSLIAAATRSTTMVVPIVPTKVPAAPDRSGKDRLPSDERGMLFFVSALLALGTLAIVAMAGFGR